MTAAQPQPVLVPIPADFPVQWEHPGDERLPWVQDRMHSPDPLTPLERSFFDIAYGGFNLAAEAYAMPVRANIRYFNTYLYMAIAPAVPPEQMEAQGKLSEEKMGAAVARLGELWQGEWLPEIQSHLAWWDAFDLRGAAAPALLDHLDETLERSHRLWEIHFRIVFPTYVAISLFDDLHRDLFGAEGAFDAYKLLQGIDNKTIESGRALWDLSRKALALPEVRQILETRAEVLPALGGTAAGRAFLDELRAYLEVYGARGDKWGLSYPSWIEDPAPVIKNLKDYITRSDRDPRAEQAQMAAQREQSISQARQRLKGYPQQVVEQYEFLLKAAHQGVVLTEDHGFWIDFNSMYRARRVFMEVGRRLAGTGAIESPDHVFCLTVDEVRQLIASGGDQRARVAQRRAELERFRTIDPPPALGMDYGPPPDNPVSRFLGKFFGGPPPAAEEPGTLKGHAGSAGKVRGRARVIRSLDEAGRLKLGDILVAETTAPPWTPLFATAGGIVTDTGGILSHCAVVAREYRIPAVVGTGAATKVIREGQLLEVDGDAGTVRIVEE
ncbi:MAG: hypothetical protein HYW07_02240 [Candidatus Latescibacteria bacterium]|nr:hypothetical protein [Candidatus Latescibacterota bacterium]